MAAARRGHKTAVMLIDVDHFKSVNDNMGHAAGDELLRVVANRLRDCVRETDTIARLGGDEFALLLSESEQPHDATLVAHRLLEAIGRPIIIDPRANGRVTMFSNAPMNADAFYRTFLAALEIRGLVARESGNTIMIVPLEENRE